jgi:hypothetical protein
MFIDYFVCPVSAGNRRKKIEVERYLEFSKFEAFRFVELRCTEVSSRNSLFRD